MGYRLKELFASFLDFFLLSLYPSKFLPFNKYILSKSRLYLVSDPTYEQNTYHFLNNSDFFNIPSNNDAIIEIL